MKVNDEKNSSSGNVPEYGAIFMSNSSTKKECFQRRLLGLPSWQGQFVEQVKAGMILFLFEYESRLLYGVFQACCDGAINIVPHAFSSSGKQFPAQVNFTPVWYCNPLPENTFRDAIRDNYFSANKFNFGLSEYQVRRLLYLFSMKKLNVQLLERQLNKIEVAKLIESPKGDELGAFDDGMSVKSERVKNEHDQHLSEFPTDSRGDYFWYSRDIDNIKFMERHMIGNKRKLGSDLGLATSSRYGGDYLGNTSNKDLHIVPGDNSFITSHRSAGPHIAKGGNKVASSNDYPSLYQSNVNASIFSRKPISETNSLVQEQHRSSSIELPPMQQPISKFSCRTPLGDVLSDNALQYDHGAPSFNFLQSPSIGVSYSSNTMQEHFSFHENSMQNNIHSLNNKPCNFYPELNDMHNYQECYPDFVNHRPLSSSNHYELSSSRTGISYSGVGNHGSETTSFREKGHKDIALSKSPSVRLSNIGSGRKSKSPRFLSSPGKYDLIAFDNNMALQNNHWHRTTQWKNMETSAAIFHMEKEDHPPPVSCDPKHDKKTKSFSSGSQNNRKSVFSRLAYMKDVPAQTGKSVISEDSAIDPSVDELMERLHRRHYKWLNMKNFEPLVKHDDAENFRIKSQTSVLKAEKDCLEGIWKETSMTATRNSNQTSDETRFLDFKHRSEVQKTNGGTVAVGCNKSNSENLLAGKQKRRKLIRPNFSKNESSYDKGIIGDSSEKNIQVSLSREGCITIDSAESCDALVGEQDNSIGVSPNGEVPHLICESHAEEKSSHAGNGFNKKVRVECCVASPTTGVKDESESLQNFGSQNAPSLVYCEDKSCYTRETLSIKNPFVDGLLQDCNHASFSMQEMNTEIGKESTEKEGVSSRY
ncbi:DCD (Development and Cell Death) domain protein [Quillaja saponaria]|uniref:DCD (Development and Cell Death) domain protein n=1 Tax=Quillaja saponaria TaxID=32244 RepID=A0AAD7M414_QUISA|nr:DCD (Development and Cell Death) domain protein [Quillaja saponaria]KAJ7969303.1 DCD (Development and Cell Death) domain protein [Quillaja saponaria]